MSNMKISDEMRAVFAAWGSQGGKKAAKKMTKQQRPDKIKRGWETRRKNQKENGK